LDLFGDGGDGHHILQVEHDLAPAELLVAHKCLTLPAP
jgi:hypothetical protein